jgi:GNAT superfamily N-acetyltransferase
LPDITQAETKEQIAAVQNLWRDYTKWAATLMDYAMVGTPPTFEGLEEELAGLPGVYVPPSGRLLLATHEGKPAGTVALKPHTAVEGELKRLYVRPDFRGHGIGQALVAALLDEARAVGYQRLVLDSHILMKSAHALYEAAGFRFVPTPDDFPAALKPFVVFMECDLAA